MKTRRFLLIFTLFASAFGALASEPADTVISVSCPRSVVIVSDGSSKSVRINGINGVDGSYFDYSISADTSSAPEPDRFLLPFVDTNTQTKHRQASVGKTSWCHGFYVGMSFGTADVDAMKTSWEIGLTQAIGYSLGKGGSEFSFGVGFGYRRTCLGAGYLPVKREDSLLLEKSPEDASSVSSRINSWAIHLPFMFTRRIHRSFGFKVGIIANFNFYTTASSRFTLSGASVKNRAKGLHQRMLTPDLLLSVGAVNKAGIYLRWSPVGQFKRQYGPEITYVSTGLTLGF